MNHPNDGNWNPLYEFLIQNRIYLFLFQNFEFPSHSHRWEFPIDSFANSYQEDLKDHLDMFECKCLNFFRDSIRLFYVWWPSMEEHSCLFLLFSRSLWAFRRILYSEIGWHSCCLKYMRLNLGEAMFLKSFGTNDLLLLMSEYLLVWRWQSTSWGDFH